MSARPKLLDQYGREFGTSMRAAHDSSDRSSRELGAWNPSSYSADGEWLGEIEASRDRLDDLIRNNGIASGAVQTHIDNTIGSGLLLNYRPDRLALGLKEGARDEELDEFENTVEAKFDAYSEDINFYIDASRRCRLSGLLAQGYRSYLSSFEICATGEWLKRTGTKYRTCIQTIDPRRLCNPLGERNSDKLREGVVLGEMGEPTDYWFASHILGDPTGIDGSAFRTWKKVPRETPWGRQNVIHIYDVDKAGRSRGKSGVLSILAAHKMHEKWTKASVEAAIYNSLYAAYIESPLDWPSVAAAMGAGEESDPTSKYVENLTTFHKQGNVRFNGLRIPHLYPGEELKHLTPEHPAPSFEAFERAANRRLAAGWNLTYPQVSRDYSQSNYSSERAALLEVYRFFGSRQYHIAGLEATMIFALWLEEAIDLGDVVLPSGLPDFYEARSAWIGCDWIGPGRGNIDLLKEANGKKVWKSMGIETMESLASEHGKRWRKLIDQTAQEERYMRARGLDPAKFSGETPVEQPADTQQVDKDGNPVGQPESGDGGAPAAKPAPKKPAPAGGGGAAAAAPQIVMPSLTINIPGQAPIQVDMTPVAEAIRAAGETRAVRELEQGEAISEVADGLIILGENVAGHGKRLDDLRADLNRPTALIKDGSGRTIGARRVDKLPGGEE